MSVKVQGSATALNALICSRNRSGETDKAHVSTSGSFTL